MVEPSEGRWYWVRMAADDAPWYPAMRCKSACGGWSNRDTWEDFSHEVHEWVEIETPHRKSGAYHLGFAVGLLAGLCVGAGLSALILLA